MLKQGHGRGWLGHIAVANMLLWSSLAMGAGERGAQWRDLNHNGALDRYEDARLSFEERVEDLLARLTIEEKIGLMVHASLPGQGSAIGASTTGYDMARARSMIEGGKINSFITRLVVSPAEFARQNNMVQRLAEDTRLGIPVTISTDPRHHFQATLGASTTGGGFTLWPDMLGFAAQGNAALVRRFGDIARQEYRAVGIHMALSPQADVGSEPRWARFPATFGSDPAAISRLAGAYVEGFQGSAKGVARDGVATVVKHWVGYGAASEGFDGHNAYGRNVTLSNSAFADHVRAFDGPLSARSEGVMPTYVAVHGVKIGGIPVEPVGAGFNKQLLTGLLRTGKAYRGLIISDWAITNDCPETCTAPSAGQPQTPKAIGMPWGVENLTETERFAKGVEAGVDQFGGVDDAAPILAAVRNGVIKEARIDQSVRRILSLKFRLGLFDNPYVDEATAVRVVGNAAWQREADVAQRQSQILLRNQGAVLPLKGKKKIWLFGVDANAAMAAGYVVVDDPAAADVALIRTATPYETLHPYHFFGSRQHEGRLDFREDDAAVAAMKRAAAHIPVILAVEMDRPAILTNLLPYTKAVLVNFGTSDAALLDILAGRSAICGHLPFALPQSMVEVERQRSDRTDDGKQLFKRGAGLCLKGAGGAKEG